MGRTGFGFLIFPGLLLFGLGVMVAGVTSGAVAGGAAAALVWPFAFVLELLAIVALFGLAAHLLRGPRGPWRGGWDRPGRGGWDRPGHGDRDRPGHRRRDRWHGDHDGWDARRGGHDDERDADDLRRSGRRSARERFEEWHLLAHEELDRDVPHPEGHRHTSTAGPRDQQPPTVATDPGERPTGGRTAT